MGQAGTRIHNEPQRAQRCFLRACFVFQKKIIEEIQNNGASPLSLNSSTGDGKQKGNSITQTFLNYRSVSKPL